MMTPEKRAELELHFKQRAAHQLNGSFDAPAMLAEVAMDPIEQRRMAAQREVDGGTMNEPPSRSTSPPDKKRRHLPFKTLADLAAEGDVQKKWLIKGIFARGETSAWVGPPGSMKSSVLCSAAIHASSPKMANWFGYRCKEKTASLYFALERSDLVKRRMMAECNTLEIDFPPIAIIQKQFTLARPGEYRLLVDTIKAAEDQFGMAVGLAIFDTLAKLIAAGGGDENSARDCNMVFSNIAELKNETNVHAAFAAHTGKEVSRGTRGSNAQPGDFDMEVIISGDTVRTPTVTKINDGPEGPLFSFTSKVHTFGTDADGDPITINIVSSDEVSQLDAATTAEPKLSTNQRVMFRLLREADPSGLSIEAWNDLAREQGITTKQRLYEARMSLRDKKLVREYAGIWRANA